MLPGGWLRAYVAHQRYSESPTAFHFWTGVSTIAGALRRKVWIDQLAYQYTPNFYIILVAPPGVAAKSTSINQGISLLRKIKDVHFGPPSLTWQALLDSLKLSATADQIPGIPEPIVSSCITVSVSELGTFMRPENREMLDHLTTLWDGQKGFHGRKTLQNGEMLIENPWLNIIACTTPSWIQDNIPDALIGGGLASRIVFVFAREKHQLVAYPRRQVKNLAQFKLEEEHLLNDLEIIGKMAGEYELSEEAYAWGEEWYERHYTTARSAHLNTSRMEGYLARKQAHIHKLAIVLAASTRDELTITTDDLIEAEAHVTSLEATMNSVFESIGVSYGAAALTELVNMIKRSRGGISYKALFILVSKTMDGQTFKTNLNMGIENGLISRTPMKSVPGDYMLTYSGPRE